MEDQKDTLRTLAGLNADAILTNAAPAAEGFKKLYTIVSRLRAQDGCPWDREQTPLSIRNNIIEEAYELVEAITAKDSEHTKEELGDLFMLATMTLSMYEQDGSLRASDVFDAVVAKLVRRHPHVFGDSDASTPDQVVAQWNEIKEKKEGRRKKDSILDDVPKHLPPLEKAYKIQKKAAKVGFDWADSKGVWDKLVEESKEVQEAASALPTFSTDAPFWIDAPDSPAAKDTQAYDRLEQEMGDLLFTAVNLARFYKIDPSLALQRANEKFTERFHYIENQLKKDGTTPDPSLSQRMENLWDEAKGQKV
ncbi:MAG TPA: nucleoside triphosphate pyrophosphohydrolase [Spirochaetales bacterium]|nr:nucleoside triphosphate pyrophosphohydrolase [Spirochaetales bacterium]